MKIKSTVAILAAFSAMALAAPQAANAAHHKKMHMAKAKLIPSQPKPGYHSMVGTPALIDPVPVVGGGALGLGVIPSSGMFKGVPVLGDLGL